MNQPLFAEILAINDSSTHAVVWVFSKPVLREFTGQEHHKKACEWVVSWQQHLDYELSFIKGELKKIIDTYVCALSLHGVSNEALLKAEKILRENTPLYEQGIL